MTEPSSSESWQTLAALVDTLLDASPDQRAGIIAQMSGGDMQRRAELEDLLTACERDAPLLSRSAAETFSALFDDDAAPFPEALADRYRLERELGRGGMATVYLATDLKHGRDVAVKVVHPIIASAWGADRFLREIEIVAQLQHPNIVPLYDSGEASGALYYVMPHESGASLRQRLVRETRLPVDDVVLILRDVCDALAYAHGRGIVHRDIKPDNILLSGRHAMVSDFGVAKAATDAAATGTNTAAGVVLGTPVYMAPEQIAAEPRIDHRADIYSLGVLAYELLAGQPPFGREARQNLLSAHLTEPPRPLTTYRQDLPARLVDIVMKCLAKQPADRWQSADEIRQHLDALGIISVDAPVRRPRWMSRAAITAGVALAAIAVAIWARNARAGSSLRARWANAHIERITDFPGSEVDAAISSDGRFVAFLADRDSVFDALVTQVGSGQFTNLTVGRVPQLFNEDVRNVGFSADGSNVWIRVADIASPASVSVIPTLGGTPRAFLGTAVMAVWSPDGLRVAYHETTPGDPIYVANGDGSNARRIFVAEPGIHCHHLSWSPDARYLYFSHGTPPDEMDVWRVSAAGGRAERITTHNSRVAYPVLLDQQTLLYTATDDDGTGPWLYASNVDKRIPERLSNSVEHYISIAASADVPGRPRRLAATVSNPSVNLWSVPIGDGVAGEQAANQVPLPTARSAAPRFLSDSSILYLASRGGADGLWRLTGRTAIELWKPTQGAVVGAPAVSPDGKTACFPVRHQSRSTLYCAASDGTAARVVAESLDVRGAASWSPDGKWLAVAAKAKAGVRVFRISANGGPPVQLVDSVSANPVWAPDGAFILYSGTPRARSVPVKAVTPDGRPYPIPPLSVDRVGDSYRFLPGSGRLVVKLGGFRRQDFWLFDLESGDRRRLTSLRSGESLHRFDISPDGTRILFERVRENSDVVLIEIPRP